MEYDGLDGLSGADDYLTQTVLLSGPGRPPAGTGTSRRHPATGRAPCRRPGAGPGRGAPAGGRTPINLTAKESAVLEFLLRRRDQVITKTEIIAGVWDEARDPDPNLVEV
nr:winged helix-turn-helix domain-containing protein [Saccharothrix sp. NRRL B-16348]